MKVVVKSARPFIGDTSRIATAGIATDTQNGRTLRFNSCTSHNSCAKMSKLCMHVI